MNRVILKKNRTASVLRRHPWIFSSAIRRVTGNPVMGETVAVTDADNRPLALGAYSPRSQITVRIWTFDTDTFVSPAFFQDRLAAAVGRRTHMDPAAPDVAGRLVNAESDDLPGLIVDRYANVLVCQFLTAGSAFWKNAVVSSLETLFPGIGIYERSDADIRRKEGLAPTKGVLSGNPPSDVVEIREGENRFLVDVINGHKTGFYLDQRLNRLRLQRVSAGKTVLNAFCYTGGFGISAMRGGAESVINIDTSSGALELAGKNFALNGFTDDRVQYQEGDVFQVLRSYRDAARRFDLIVLDPPKFAESRRNLERAGRGYKDINLLALKLLAPGGLLFTFSCSGLMTPELFQKVVGYAALDAGRPVQIIGRLEQADDHPVSLTFPEGHYLKGLICRVD